MKSLKLLFAIGLFITFGNSLAQAQPGGGGRDVKPEERAQRQTEHLTEALSLSASQQSQVSQINLDFAQKMDEQRAKVSSREEARELREALRAEQTQALKTVLTTEQAQKLDELAQERGQRKRGKRKKKEDDTTPDQ